MVEILQSTVQYQAKSKLLELALFVANTKNLKKCESQIIQGAKIHRLLQALDYDDFLTKAQRDRIVRTLVEVAEINDFGIAPSLGNIEPPSIVVGVRGRDGSIGATGPEGGGVPISATNVSIDTIVDSFPITDSRGVEYCLNIYDDSNMRVMRIQGGWSADGSDYADDGGIGTHIIGDTSGIAMSVIVSGSTVQLFATVTSGTWVVEGTRKYVPNNGNGIVNPTTLASGKIWVGSSTNQPTAVSVSGDISISTAGVASITSGSIVNSDISSTASISVSKLQSLTASKAVVTNSSGVLTTSAASAAQVGFLSTVTSDVQVQLDSKISSAAGAISTVVSTNLTSDRAVISNPSGKIAVSATTSTELGYVSGATSNLQNQISNRLPLTGGTMTGDISADAGVDITLTGSGLLATANGAFVGGINGRGAFPGGISTEGPPYTPYWKVKVMDIGIWNMTNYSKVIAHGLPDHTKIIGVNAIIVNDTGTSHFVLAFNDTSVGGRPDISSTNIVLTRMVAWGDCVSTSVNRGKLTIMYEA